VYIGSGGENARDNQYPGAGCDCGRCCTRVIICAVPRFVVAIQMITIRCSALPSYDDCPRRSACRIIRREIAEAGYSLSEPVAGVGAAVGTGVHAGADALTWGGASLDASSGAAVDAMREGIAGGAVWDATTPNAGTAERQVVRQVAAFADCKDFAPDESGRPVRMSAAICAGFELAGTKDLRSGSTIVDWKFASVARPYQAQLGGYSLLDRVAASRPDRIAIVHVPRVKISHPQQPASVVSYDVGVSERAAWSVIQRIVRDVKAFLASGSPHEFAANPMSTICSPKYCQAYGTEWCEITKGTA
jgi:hypothetical protein